VDRAGQRDDLLPQDASRMSYARRIFAIMFPASERLLARRPSGQVSWPFRNSHIMLSPWAPHVKDPEIFAARQDGPAAMPIAMK
jgi:hypothetical protein